MDKGSYGEGDFASLNDDEIIEKIRQAREAGDTGQIRMATGILAFRRYYDVFARVRVKIRDSRTDAEDVAMLVIENAITAKFQGEHMGQFVNMLHTITDRRIADYYVKRNKQLQTTPMGEDRSTDEEIWTEVLVDPEQEIEGLPGRLEFEAVIEALGDRHREVVRLRIDGYSSKEAADAINAEFVEEKIPMSASNVDQIMKRFRVEYANLLEGGE